MTAPHRKTVPPRRVVALLAASLAFTGVVLAAAAAAIDPALVRAIDSAERSPKYKLRDSVRHPGEELTFFGLSADQTVVEIWPGGGYWTEILGPYLREHGHYIAALEPIVPEGEGNAGTEAWIKRIEGNPALYGAVKRTWLGHDQSDIAAPGSADLVLTFRNLHNWMYEGYVDEALSAAFRALKPGGILGIEEHRGRADRPQDPKAENGYVREDYTIALVEKAGFRLIGKSEINANPRDTKDWVDGVWTLPPTLSQGERDREKYIAIGEADNYVLKFEKPRS